MKKTFLNIILACSILLSLTGCDSNTLRLRQLIKELNKECPIPLGEIGQMDKASYHGNTVTFEYAIHDENIGALCQEDVASMHHFILNSYSTNTDTTFRTLLKAIVDAKADLHVVFYNGDKHEKTVISITFSNEELAQCLNSDGDPEAALQNIIEGIRLQMPIQLSEGMVNSAVSMDEEYLSYSIQCNEDLVDINDVQANEEEAKSAMKELIATSTDPTFVKMIDLLRSTHRGLAYHYIGTTSGKESVISITPEEL